MHERESDYKRELEWSIKSPGLVSGYRLLLQFFLKLGVRFRLTIIAGLMFKR